MFYFWLLIIIMLTVIEISTINLTTIWFVISGLVVLFLTFITNDFLIQFGVFVLGGIFLLLTTRRFLIKLLNVSDEKTNLDRVVGITGIVTSNISTNQVGEVKVDGKHWTAYADSELKVGTTVKVLKIDGVKLQVEEEL